MFRDDPVIRFTYGWFLLLPKFGRKDWLSYILLSYSTAVKVYRKSKFHFS
jgi:hypothetical protein